MEIKQYKPLALVFYIDGNGNRSALPLDDAQREAFKKRLEEVKMIELDGVVINTYEIKEIRPASKTTELEKYYYSRTWEERAVIDNNLRKRLGNSKVNTLEAYAELGTTKAIEQMERVLDGWYRSMLPKEDKPDTDDLFTPAKPLTEEQREEIRQRFSNIKDKLTK